ncbi:hypothetical protein NQ317_006779 [Molorchus minor]|uniref:Uncharacterized protein n=1 Tax=Molorchus minor TaxID=1323400 RepID=A0ABQ9IWE7_9CUCU|nr:hypothetical protein NQ317_006779 [Molorchus minor]
MANGGIPKFYEFKDDVDDWEVYSERLEQHFVANNVKAEEIKVAVLLSSISASTFTLIKNLCYPSPPQTKKFQELSQLLNHQFSAAKSVWRERIKFYELSQGTRSISEWYAAVRGMATKCNFGTDLPKILKDKFVTGLSPGKVLDRLCEEEESATLENLYALAMKKEQSTIVEVRFVSRSKFPPRGSHFRRPNGNGSYQSRHSARVTSRQEYQPEERQNTEIDRRFDRRQNGKNDYANRKSSRDIDKEIEGMVNACDSCLENKQDPPKSELTPWPITSEPFQRVHVDFLGPVNSKMYFILTDSFTKWGRRKSPFEMMFNGRRPRTRLSQLTEETGRGKTDKAELSKVQNRMQKHQDEQAHNYRGRKRVFDIGDEVYVRKYGPNKRWWVKGIIRRGLDEQFLSAKQKPRKRHRVSKEDKMLDGCSNVGRKSPSEYFVNLPVAGFAPSGPEARVESVSSPNARETSESNAEAVGPDQVDLVNSSSNSNSSFQSVDSSSETALPPECSSNSISNNEKVESGRRSMRERKKPLWLEQYQVNLSNSSDTE